MTTRQRQDGGLRGSPWHPGGISAVSRQSAAATRHGEPAPVTAPPGRFSVAARLRAEASLPRAGARSVRRLTHPSCERGRDSVEPAKSTRAPMGMEESGPCAARPIQVRARRPKANASCKPERWAIRRNAAGLVQRAGQTGNPRPYLAPAAQSGVEQLEAHRAHNPEVRGSNPRPATLEASFVPRRPPWGIAAEESP